jgi:hypothetical protein
MMLNTSDFAQVSAINSSKVKRIPENSNGLRLTEQLTAKR